MADENEADAPSGKKRGGSNKRQRNWQFVVRCTRDEFNNIAGLARAAGLRGAAWLRARGQTTGDPGPRSQRIPPVENEVLLRLLGSLGRLNNNVNQIAHAANCGEYISLPELRRVLQDYRPIRDAVFEALGKTPTGATVEAWRELGREAARFLKASPGAGTVAVPAEFLQRVMKGPDEAAEQPDTSTQASNFIAPKPAPDGS